MLKGVFIWIAIFATSTAALAADVLVFGGTRNTGLEAVKLLVARGDQVTAFVRESSDTTVLQGLGATLVVGDALDAASVEAAFAQSSFDAVVTTISGSVRNTDVDSQGNINIFSAAEKAGVKRVVFVTAIGAGGTEGLLEPRARQFLKPVLDAKTLAENDLRSRALDWTILRPGQLPDGEATGTGTLYDETVMGRISRAELGAVIVRVLDDDSTIGKVYHSLDSQSIGSFSSFD
jgi:uncharacterized protein YbjT (DUF2867 family)